jgi:RecB family exonuclease
MSQLRTFASSAELQNFLLEEGSPDTLIIVPHQRLARQIWHKQRLVHLATGQAAWEPLPCLTLGAWWRELCRRLWLAQTPAPPLKRLAVWRRAILDGPPLEGVQADLEWAKALDEAYENLSRHLLPWRVPQFADSPLVSWRRAVTKIYEETLREENLFPPSQLPGFLSPALDKGALRLFANLLVVSLKEPAPVEEAWLQVAARHTRVQRLEIRGDPQTVQAAYAFASQDEEMAWVAADLVACHHREGIPLHRLAVTSPAMDGYAPRFRRLLAELLGPAQQESQWAYNFSAGPCLKDAPLFNAALLPLRFAALGERREDLAALLSPYFRGLQQPPDELSSWDRLFREERLVQGWPVFRAAVVRKFQADVNLLNRLDQAFAAVKGTSRPLREWLAGLQDAWRVLGFPGELTATEAVQHRRLLDLLSDLNQALGQETVTTPEFLEWLSLGAREIVLPGEGVQEAGIQILGLLEMRDLDFDRVWCLGMNSGILPAPPRVLPLLSPEERNRVLGGTYASQHEFAADLYDSLLGSASHLTFTRPQTVNDEEQVETPLYSGLWQSAPDWHPILSRPQPAWLLAPPAKAAFTVEQGSLLPPHVPEPLGIPLPAELRVTQWQTALACPCRFLCEVLLAIQELPDIEAGLPPLERGNFLHQVLARFVQRFREVLASGGDWPDAEARRILTDSVRELLGPRLADPHWEAELARCLGQEGLLLAWLSREEERFRQGWRWGGVELPFQGLTETDWPFALKGRIDRLDYHGETGEIIVWDYKSGAIPTAASIFERLEECQLPSYLAAVKQGLVQVQEPREIGALKAGFIGLKSSRKEHLKHQDFGKDAHRWDEVLQGWEDLTAEAARRLQAGDFAPAPRPAPLKKKQGACEYCCYHLICGFTPEASDDAVEEEA